MLAKVLVHVQPENELYFTFELILTTVKARKQEYAILTNRLSSKILGNETKENYFYRFGQGNGNRSIL